MSQADKMLKRIKALTSGKRTMATKSRGFGLGLENRMISATHSHEVVRQDLVGGAQLIKLQCAQPIEGERPTNVWGDRTGG